MFNKHIRQMLEYGSSLSIPSEYKTFNQREWRWFNVATTSYVGSSLKWVHFEVEFFVNYKY